IQPCGFTAIVDKLQGEKDCSGSLIRQGKFFTKAFHVFFYSSEGAFFYDCLMDKTRNSMHFALPHAAARYGWRAHTDARRIKRRKITWHRVAVCDNANALKRLLGNLARNIFLAHIQQHEVRVGAAGYERMAKLLQGVRKYCSIFYYVPLVRYK